MERLTNCIDCNYQIDYTETDKRECESTFLFSFYCPHCGTKNKMSLIGWFLDVPKFLRELNDNYEV